MEFYQDLIVPVRKIKNKFLLWLLAVLLIVLMMAEIYVYIIKGRGTVDYFNAAFWIIYTLIMFIRTITGRSVVSFFGKAYIQITDDALKLKPSVLKKEQLIYWKDLSRLSMKPTFIKVTGQDGNTISIDFKSLEYQAVQDLKDAVKALIDEGKIKAA
jgi:hypothetical protein